MSKYLTRTHVDRSEELNSLVSSLQAKGSDTKRIFLVHAQPNYGKSLLRDAFLERVDAGGHDIAITDLDLGPSNAQNLLSDWATQFGTARFPLYEAAIDEVAQAMLHIEVKNNLQFGSAPRIEMNYAGDPARQRLINERLTRAWFEDAAKWMKEDNPAVLVIDTYNTQGSEYRPTRVDGELSYWVESVLLLHARRLNALRVVILGQQTPRFNHTWNPCCHRMELQPISDPNDWLDLAKEYVPTIKHEFLSLICFQHRGIPGEIVAALQNSIGWKY